MKWIETQIRVRYAETDKMGIVHHSNYFVWFELARSEFCRSRGFSYLELEEEHGAFMIVSSAKCEYLSPAFYEDVLKIRATADSVRSRSIAFSYEIYRPSDETRIARGSTVHYLTDKDQKIRSIPPSVRELMLSG